MNPTTRIPDIDGSCAFLMPSRRTLHPERQLQSRRLLGL